MPADVIPRRTADEPLPAATTAFRAEVEAALVSNAVEASFLALFLVDVDPAAQLDLRRAHDTRRTALASVSEQQESGETTGWHTDGSIGVLRPVVASPTEAIARCDRLLDTVRAAVRADALQPAPRVNVGLALWPRRSSGAGALFDAAGIAVRSAARMGGDQWAAA